MLWTCYHFLLHKALSTPPFDRFWKQLIGSSYCLQIWHFQYSLTNKKTCSHQIQSNLDVAINKIGNGLIYVLSCSYYCFDKNNSMLMMKRVSHTLNNWVDGMSDEAYYPWESPKKIRLKSVNPTFASEQKKVSIHQ